MKARTALTSTIIGIVCTVITVPCSAQNSADNPSVTTQLNSVKPLVAQISKDASKMVTYTMKTGLSWDTHVETLTNMKQDVNKMQESMRGLSSHRATASSWQQDAIDRVVALANDLATSMNSTIDALNKSKSKPINPPYPEYVKANAQIVKDLSDEINGIIDYGPTKQKMESLQKEIS